MNEKKKSRMKETTLPTLLLLAGSMCVGAVTGVLILKFGFSSQDIKEISFPQYILKLSQYLLLLFVAYLTQLVIHESGHLVAGLQCGFRFLSFRVGQFTMVRENGRIALKQLSVAGTGGQCLMIPPEEDTDEKPYMWYLLGGVLMNLFAAVLSAFLFVLTGGRGPLSLFFLLLAITGIAIVALNGLPIQMKLVTNDGYNVRAIRNDTAALYALRMQRKNVMKRFEKIRRSHPNPLEIQTEEELMALV